MGGGGFGGHLEEAMLSVQELSKVQVSAEAPIFGGGMRPCSWTPGGALHICQVSQGTGLASAT